MMGSTLFRLTSSYPLLFIERGYGGELFLVQDIKALISVDIEERNLCLLYLVVFKTNILSNRICQKRGIIFFINYPSFFMKKI